MKIAEKAPVATDMNMCELIGIPSNFIAGLLVLDRRQFTVFSSAASRQPLQRAHLAVEHYSNAVYIKINCADLEK
jgi:hypothetical protein